LQEDAIAAGVGTGVGAVVAACPLCAELTVALASVLWTSSLSVFAMSRKRQQDAEPAAAAAAAAPADTASDAPAPKRAKKGASSAHGRRTQEAVAASVAALALQHAALDIVPAGAVGSVLAFGSGDCAQLGLGAEEKMRERKKPTLLPDLAKQNVLRIAVGSLHNLVLVAPQRAVFSWGCNDDQALGRSTDEWLPAPVAGLLGQGDSAELPGGVVQIACGASHSIALTAEGDVYSWGTYRDANGVIGFSDTVEAATEPTKLTSLPKGAKVVQVAAGESHDVLLTEQGEGQSIARLCVT
jgi:regulator of chromosome condensation